MSEGCLYFFSKIYPLGVFFHRFKIHNFDLFFSGDFFHQQYIPFHILDLPNPTQDETSSLFFFIQNPRIRSWNLSSYNRDSQKTGFSDSWNRPKKPQKSALPSVWLFLLGQGSLRIIKCACFFLSKYQIYGEKDWATKKYDKSIIPK